MVKPSYIGVFYKHPNDQVVALKDASDLSSFGFFQRNSVNEFMKFTSKMVVERSDASSRVSVKEQEYQSRRLLFCLYGAKQFRGDSSNRSDDGDKLAACVISDHEYPHRVAHNLLTNVMDEFSSIVPTSSWATATDNSVTFLGIDKTLSKIILHSTITALLTRGEKLDDLVAKSEDLSAQSKVFYKTARKTNQCCHLL